MWTDPNNRTLEEWKEEILKLNEEEDYCYIIHCDLDYSKELLSEYKYLPLAYEYYNKDSALLYLIRKIMLPIVEILNSICKKE